MKHIVGLILLLLTLLLTGCATTSMASLDQDAKAKEFTPSQDKASLYIYRNEIMGAGVHMDVDLNGKKIGETVAQSYFELNLNPGVYNIVSHAENDSELSMTLEAGKNYFVWQETKMGFLYARNKLQQVDDATGRAGVKESKMIAVSSGDFGSTQPNPQANTDTESAGVPEMVDVQNTETQNTQQKNAQTPEVAPSSQPQMASAQLNGIFGVSSVTVERLAMKRNCQPAGAATLTFKDGPTENYLVKCTDGSELGAHCEYRQCTLK
jgi:hypothetical protein